MLTSIFFYAIIATLWSCARAATTTCHEYVIVSTRGTTELQGPSIAFKNMTAETLAKVPGGIEFDTVYPANAEATSYTDGYKSLTTYVLNGIEACPDQKYALLGYSQGATVTSLALQNFSNIDSPAFQAISAVLLVGNPGHKPFQAANVDELGGSSTDVFLGSAYSSGIRVPDVWYRTTKLIDICYLNDIVCNGVTPNGPANATGDGILNHLKYGSTATVQRIGAAFLIGALTPAFNLSSIN